MSFLTPLGWVLTSTGILAPAGIPMILADRTATGQTLGNAAENVVKAGTATAANISDKSVLSDAQVAAFKSLDADVRKTQFKKAKAQKLKNEWIQWYTDLSFWDQNFNGEKFNEARNRWIDILAAESDNPDEFRMAWRLVPSLEQTLGLPDPRLTTGYYPLESKPLIPDVPLSFKVGAGVSAAVILGLLLKFR